MTMHLNTADLHQSLEHPLAKVGWTCPPQSTSWRRSCSLLPKKFSQLPNLHNFITSSLFNVLLIVVLALHPSLLLLDHLNHPLLKLLIAPFSMLHLVSVINSLYLFVNLILVSVPPLPTHLLLPYHFFLFCFTTMLIHNSISLLLTG